MECILSVHPREISELGYEEKDLLDEIHSNNCELTNIDGTPVDKFECIEYIVKFK